MENYLIIDNDLNILLLGLFLIIHFLVSQKSIWTIKRKEIAYNNWEIALSTFLLAGSIYLGLICLANKPLILTAIILLLLLSTISLCYKLHFDRGDKGQYRDACLAKLLFKVSYQYVLINIWLALFTVVISIYAICFFIGKLILIFKVIAEPKRCFQYFALYVFSFLLVNLLKLNTFVLNLGLPLIVSVLLIFISSSISSEILEHLKKQWQKIWSLFNLAYSTIMK